MPKTNEQFNTEHEAFRRRLRAIHKGPIGQAAKSAMKDLRKAYRDAAVEHWRELGPNASTGWGPIPKEPSMRARYADDISRGLAEYFSNDPNDPPGSKKVEG